jgi:Tol biopolymer transport system component
MPTGDNQKPQPLDPSPANESQAILSADIRLIAYVSDESGSDEVYVRSFPPADGRWQISAGGGTHPRWHGRQLYFLSSDGHIMAVDVWPAFPPQFSDPRRLFDVRGAEGFAVSPDGQRFLVQLPAGEPRTEELHVVLNWASELGR